MQHAEAQERLADLALEPRLLTGLGEDPSPEAGALRRHLAECATCSADLAAWRLTWAHVGAALDDLATAGGDADRALGQDDARTVAAPDDAVSLPATLRAKTLARVAADRAARPEHGQPGMAPGEGARRREVSRGAARRGRWAPWLAIAAALVIALGAGSLAWTRTRDLDRAHQENAGLTATMASLDRVLATPVHWTVTLRTPDGVDGGTMAWSGAEIAVITTALPGPADGQSYRCWVEREGVRTPIGPMWFSGTTGYWAGAMGSWSALLKPGSRMGVSLMPAGNSPATPVLIGSL